MLLDIMESSLICQLDKCNSRVNHLEWTLWALKIPPSCGTANSFHGDTPTQMDCGLLQYWSFLA